MAENPRFATASSPRLGFELAGEFLDERYLASNKILLDRLAVVIEAREDNSLRPRERIETNDLPTVGIRKALAGNDPAPSIELDRFGDYEEIRQTTSASLAFPL